jgi:hypothetical protein
MGAFQRLARKSVIILSCVGFRCSLSVVFGLNLFSAVDDNFDLEYVFVFNMSEILSIET